MKDEQLYIFIDKTGHCFEDFRRSTKTSPKDELDEIIDKAVGSKNTDDVEQRYKNLIGAMLQAGREFSVGDMLAFRDDLTDAGFKWGVDFYVKKVG